MCAMDTDLLCVSTIVPNPTQRMPSTHGGKTDFCGFSFSSYCTQSGMDWNQAIDEPVCGWPIVVGCMAAQHGCSGELRASERQHHCARNALLPDKASMLASRAVSKTYAAPVAPLFYKHLNPAEANNYIYRSDDWLMVNRYTNLIKQDVPPEFIELLTWNDYVSECLQGFRYARE